MILVTWEWGGRPRCWEINFTGPVWPLTLSSTLRIMVVVLPERHYLRSLPHWATLPVMVHYIWYALTSCQLNLNALMTLLSMLGTLDPAQTSKWSQHITQLVHAYNCTKNEVTGYSPYYLLFGQEARLHIDVCFGNSADGERGVSHLQYVERMKTELQQAYQLATETSLKVHQRNKWLYDQRVKPQMFQTKTPRQMKLLTLCCNW